MCVFVGYSALWQRQCTLHMLRNEYERHGIVNSNTYYFSSIYLILNSSCAFFSVFLAACCSHCPFFVVADAHTHIFRGA